MSEQLVVSHFYYHKNKDTYSEGLRKDIEQVVRKYERNSKFVVDEYGRQVYDQWGERVDKFHEAMRRLDKTLEGIVLYCAASSVAMDDARGANLHLKEQAINI